MAIPETVMRPCSCIAAADFDVWSKYDWTEGLQLDAIGEFDAVSVRTRNSTYDFRVIHASTGDVLVRGGQHFRTYTHVRLAGCSLRGTFLKRNGIYVGFNLELRYDERTIVTTEVQSIEIGRADVQ